MAKLELSNDPTLAAIDRAIEFRQSLEKARPYLGMSSVGEECKRKLWYRFRWVAPEVFDAKSLKRFADGHASELVQAERLRMVEGVTLLTLDPESGRQIGYEDIDGHFRGHCDGEILGILQAPKTWHIWEHKAVAEKSITELEGIKIKYGEKAALKRWKPTYYAQAVLYMHYSGFTRHYMTVSSPGGRDTVSIRTDADPAEAQVLINRADSIICSGIPLDRISKTPDYFECRWCPFTGICHGGDMPASNCRTCLHSTPTKEGAWHCNALNILLTTDQQREGCPKHLFIPAFVPGEIIEAGDDFVTYKLHNGNIYTNKGESA